MRSFIFEALVLLALVLAVMALVFRNQRARSVLRTLRNAAWLYIALVFALGIYRIWQDGI
ncbi:MAG: hypothetical protein HYX53_09750 [Chloroflexi bacterium]|nr:hypothetical protein [Chloroflexota bacterium]